MELYLDSADPEEIAAASELGFVKGLTTTPTFMRRAGVADVDRTIVELSHSVAALHVEALGSTADEIVGEAHRILALPGLGVQPVLKIPVSLVGLVASRRLVAAGHKTNVHLVYTVNQAWMAMESGASFVCLLAGRLGDQGHDAIALTEQIVEIAERDRYPTRVMFSSVRHPDHVRQAALAGAHVCTIPWRVLLRLAENTLTARGATTFREDTRLLTLHAADVMRPRNPVCRVTDTVLTALTEMTESGMGAVSVVDEEGRIVGIFTDGDIRRRLQSDGPGFLDGTMADAGFTRGPLTIGADELLLRAQELFRARKVDNLIVVSGEKPVGILDVQDLVEQDREP